MRKTHQDDVRAKIQASNIITRLMKHMNGEVDMSATQVQAARILLDKAVSNAPTVLAGDPQQPLVVLGGDADKRI